jgi:peroxiredoxin
MKQSLLKAFATVALTYPLIAGAVKTGDAAPDFHATDVNGKAETLSQYRGKYVVLEWTNKDCPYTRKHYVSGNMQALQKEWTGKGVVWLTVLSSAPGMEGYMDAPAEQKQMQQVHALPTTALLDPTGEIGHLYEARTTPHMYVIDPNGKLIYQGAIDDRTSSDPADVKGATNYVSEALSESMAGKPVLKATTRPYGCSVKYAQ